MIVEVFNEDLEVMSALLHFLSEFVHSRNNRINFDIPSVNGILLFREASKFLVIYGIHPWLHK